MEWHGHIFSRIEVYWIQGFVMKTFYMVVEIQ